MLCLTCLNETFENKDYCKKCENKNVLVERRNKYIYLGQVYSKSRWLKLMTSYKVFKENIISLKFFNNQINTRYLKDMFIKNVKKNTFLKVFLPCIVFSTTTLIFLVVALVIQYRAIFVIDGDVDNIKYFMYYLAILFFSICIMFFKKIFINKEKIYLTYDSHLQFKRIQYKEYLEMIKIFNININKDINHE